MSDPALPPGFVAQPAEPALPMGFELVRAAKAKGMDIFPEWLQDAAKYGPGFLKGAGKDALRGFGTLLASMGEGAGALAGEGMRDPNIGPGPKPQEEIAAALPKEPNPTSAQSLFTRLMEGAGGALAMPLPGAGLGAQAAAGGIGGVTGELSRRFATNFAPKSPGLQTAADIAGGMVGGGAAGWANAAKQTVGQQEIRRALQGQDIPTALVNAQAAKQAGSTSATAAEMFPVGSSIMRLAEQARSATPVNPLAEATANRPGDIAGLANEFLTRIQPKAVSPNAVANQTADAATGAQTTLKELRSTGIDNALMGQSIKPAETVSMENSLKQLGQTRGQRPEVRDAFNEVASKLRDADGNPLTSVQQLSLAIKSLKASAKNPLVTTATGSTIQGNDLKQAIAAAESMLGDRNPAFRSAMDDFAKFSNGPMAEQTRGPVGSLAFANPLREKQIDPSRLDSLITKNSPGDIGGAMTTLQSPVMTGGVTASPLDIARAIAQQKLHLGPTDPGAAVRGAEGSQAQQNFEALLKTGGNDAAHTMSPLSVADRLQPFLKSAGSSEAPTMQPLQYLIRPLRSIDMATTGSSMTKMYGEVAKLLADGSPESLKKLQEIAMFDPSVRRMVSAKAGIIPLMQQGEQ